MLLLPGGPWPLSMPGVQYKQLFLLTCWQNDIWMPLCFFQSCSELFVFYIHGFPLDFIYWDQDLPLTVLALWSTIKSLRECVDINDTLQYSRPLHTHNYYVFMDNWRFCCFLTWPWPCNATGWGVFLQHPSTSDGQISLGLNIKIHERSNNHISWVALGLYQNMGVQNMDVNLIVSKSIAS